MTTNAFERAVVMPFPRVGWIRIVRPNETATLMQATGACAFLWASSLVEQHDIAWIVMPFALLTYIAGRRLE